MDFTHFLYGPCQMPIRTMLYFPSFTMPSLFPQKLHATFLVLTTESPNFMLYSFPLTICTGGGKAQFVMSQ